jgi:RNA polymerase sigma-70 factor, ECF subfamily
MDRSAIGSEIVSPSDNSGSSQPACRARSEPARYGTKDRYFAGSQHWPQLMARAQAGDNRAYERLLLEVVPFVRVVAGRRNYSPDFVEEVVQDVLLTVHRVRHNYDPARPFCPWLAAITRCRLIDAWRRRGRRTSVVASGIVCETFEDPAARFEEAYATADHLSKAIAALSAPQREAIELIRLREMSLAEASKLTGRSIAALKVNAHRATKSLQRQLQSR